MMSDTEQETSDSDISLADVIEFGRNRVEDEIDAQESDVPDHADRLLVARATDVMKAINNIRMLQQREDKEDPGEDYVKDTIEEALVDLLLAIGSIDYEYDIRLADAFERRKEFIEDFMAYEEAMEDIETEEAAIEAFEEHVGEHVDTTTPGVEIGENVDDGDYDPDRRDRHIQ